MSDATLAEVIAAHRMDHDGTTGGGVCHCCDWSGPFTITSDARSHAEHLAQVVRDHLREVAGRGEVREAVARVLPIGTYGSPDDAANSVLGAFFRCVR